MLRLFRILFYMDTLCGVLTSERSACLNSNWNWKSEIVYPSGDICSHPRILKIKPSPSPHFKHLLTLLGNNLEKHPPLPWRECAYLHSTVMSNLNLSRREDGKVTNSSNKG